MARPLRTAPVAVVGTMLHQRYVLLFFVAAAVLTGITVQAASVSLFEALAVQDLRIGGVVNSTLLMSVGLAIVTFVALLRNRRAVEYVDEVVDELTKVTWPSRDETIRAATTVVFTTLFIAALLGFYDFIWKNVADVFLFTEN